MQGKGSSTDYQGNEQRGVSEIKLRHVNDYLTPLAAIIVIPGLLVATLPTGAVVVAGGLIVFSVVVNYTSMYLMRWNSRSVGVWPV